MPYDTYLEFVEKCKNSHHFNQWRQGVHKYNHRENFPIALLLLTALRYLGRGWTFDDLQENTGIGIETIWTFFLRFIEFGSTTLYNKYVVSPTTTSELRDCETEFKMAGFPGCIGSTDATHIVTERCPKRLCQLHLGYKVACTARTYNITVNHRRRVLGTTTGHPARFNDKTLVLFDQFVQKVHNDRFDTSHTFTLKDFDSHGNIIEVKYSGCYLLVDNGYLTWSCTVPPLIECNRRSEARFSEWLESLRKDVECTFGIIKCRWRVLKTGIRLHGLLNIDRIWLTCLALHNALLDVDGLNEKWRDGVRSDYQTDNNDKHLPFAIRRLVSDDSEKVYDFSGNGPGNDVILQNCNKSIQDQDVELPVETNSDGFINVRNMSLRNFCQKLIIHFNIMFQNNELKWPKRNKLHNHH